MVTWVLECDMVLAYDMVLEYDMGAGV